MSHTVLLYCETHHIDEQPLLEAAQGGGASEFLYDSAFWFDADVMEGFLTSAENLLSATISDPLVKIAHESVNLRSWGILDSVLRMMPHLDELMAQPQKILGHFVSPEMKVDHIQRERGQLSFQVSDDLLAYPRSRAFILASLESLPLFMGKMASAGKWKDRRLSFAWETRQAQMFEVEKIERQVSPGLMREIIYSLRPQVPEPFVENTSRGTFNQLESQLSKLSDYLLRAQQAIHLVSMTPEATQEILKKVNWESVKKNWPQTIEETFQSVKTLRDQIPAAPKVKQGDDDVANSENSCSPNLG